MDLGRPRRPLGRPPKRSSSSSSSSTSSASAVAVSSSSSSSMSSALSQRRSLWSSFIAQPPSRRLRHPRTTVCRGRNHRDHQNRRHRRICKSLCLITARHSSPFTGTWFSLSRDRLAGTLQDVCPVVASHFGHSRLTPNTAPIKWRQVDDARDFALLPGWKRGGDIRLVPPYSGSFPVSDGYSFR